MLPINLIILYLITLMFTTLISKKLEFYDKPNIRKVHNSKVYNTGGIIIYLFYLVIVNFFEFNHNIELIISIGFFICLVGFIDDRVNLKPSNKVLFIIIPSAYLILNGINYIDGVDGLLLVFFACCLGYYIFLIEDDKTVYFIKLLLIPIILNLILNMLPSKSQLKFFSGNTGSLFIGFFISFLTIELYNGFGVHPAFLIWPLWYPVYDFLFVSANRALLKKSVFSADNSHLHHIILKKFKKDHFKTILLFLVLNISIIYFGYLISNFSKILSLMIFIFGFLFYFLIRFKFR